VDLIPEQMLPRTCRPRGVHRLGNQNLILPAGDIKIGDKDYQVKLNSSRAS